MWHRLISLLNCGFENMTFSPLEIEQACPDREKAYEHVYLLEKIGFVQERNRHVRLLKRIPEDLSLREAKSMAMSF